jgi:hypothetical protein
MKVGRKSENIAEGLSVPERTLLFNGLQASTLGGAVQMFSANSLTLV